MAIIELRFSDDTAALLNAFVAAVGVLTDTGALSAVVKDLELKKCSDDKPEPAPVPVPVPEQVSVPKPFYSPDTEPLAPDPAPTSEHTVVELQSRVVALVRSGKKEEARAIVKKYAPCVTDIAPDKVDECWAELDKIFDF